MAIRNPLAGVPTRAARWSATHPWRAILGWIGLVTVAVGLAVLIPTNETDDMDYRKHESGQAAQWLDDAGFPDPVTENLLITSADGPDDLDTARAEAAAEAWGREMADLPGVEEVTSPVWSPDRSALLLAVRLAEDQEETAAMRAVTERVQKLAKRIYKNLYLSGYARIDFRMDAQEKVYVLEANPNPQLAHGEDFADSAEAGGLPYDRLIQRILNFGLNWRPQ